MGGIVVEGCCVCVGGASRVNGSGERLCSKKGSVSFFFVCSDFSSSLLKFYRGPVLLCFELSHNPRVDKPTTGKLSRRQTDSSLDSSQAILHHALRLVREFNGEGKDIGPHL